MIPMTRRALLAGATAVAGNAALVPSTLDFTELIPKRIPRSAIFRDPEANLWDPAMVKTPDGEFHLLYSSWSKSLGFDAWATHAEIKRATANRPEGPYRFRDKALPVRGDQFWDGHSVYNTCLLGDGGKYYLYYTGNRGASNWRSDFAPTMADEAWWGHRNNQRIGVAVANHPQGPWKRSPAPLLDTGPDTGNGITAVPNVIAGEGGGFLLYYKTLAAGPGRFGGGVVHYVARAKSPMGPFTRYSNKPLVDKRAILGTTEKFNFHIDDHVEWFQQDRYYGIVKDHDAPFMTPHGRSLLLMESPDGLNWGLSKHVLVKDFNVTWEDGATQQFERLEMPKLYLEDGKPKILLLAARAAGQPQAPSFLLIIRLKDQH